MAENKSIGQPEVTIGLFGHVDHGKTTLTEKLSGKWTDTHSEELKRGITIRLGYADTIFRKCPKCKGSEGFTVAKECPKCKSKSKPLRKVSFVDAPGHESLMATMLSGATIIDGALLLIAANEKFPQPQTREHLMALKIIGVKRLVIIQNKIDMVSEEEALKNFNAIKKFIKNSEYKDAPIIPISAQHGVNISYVIEAIEAQIPTPKKETSKDPLFLVARSFDINKPGDDAEDIQGGVLGGVLTQGILKKGDKLEIKPGHKIEREGKISFIPIETTVVSVRAGGEKLDKVGPGGSVGLMTKLDPSIVASDKLIGSVCGYHGKLPAVINELKLKTTLLERVVGSKDKLLVEPLKANEWLMLNVNTTATVGLIVDLSKDHITCKLKLPVCALSGSRVTISRMVANRWRLIGFGILEE